jgi:hypothetical protein
MIVERQLDFTCSLSKLLELANLKQKATGEHWSYNDFKIK